MKPIVSPQIRLRYPEHFQVGDFSIVDDFCYFSARVSIGLCTHIATGCSVGGGPRRTFTIGDFCSLSAGVRVWCASNDFTNDLVALVPAGVEPIQLIEGDVTMGDYTGVGANSVVMPDNVVPEGTVIGALSFVPARFAFESWSVYAGTPIRLVGRRNRANVSEQAARIRARVEALRAERGPA
jgi:acetyltransferase-like isoleucine patch superfamily enzyme